MVHRHEKDWDLLTTTCKKNEHETTLHAHQNAAKNHAHTRTHSTWDTCDARACRRPRSRTSKCWASICACRTTQCTYKTRFDLARTLQQKTKRAHSHTTWETRGARACRRPRSRTTKCLASICACTSVTQCTYKTSFDLARKLFIRPTLILRASCSKHCSCARAHAHTPPLAIHTITCTHSCTIFFGM